MIVYNHSHDGAAAGGLHRASTQRGGHAETIFGDARPVLGSAAGPRGDPAVKAAPFGYHRASSIAEAVGYLEVYEGSARVIAGGQSLVPMMNMRLLRPDAVIDINGIAELAEIRVAGDTTEVGAMVRYTTLERSPIVAERLPLLARVVRHIGDRQVRNRGTIGGSLVQGDPTGEMPLACLALGARVRDRWPRRRPRDPHGGVLRGPTRPSSTRARS